jgi:hypothetical protein
LTHINAGSHGRRNTGGQGGLLMWDTIQKPEKLRATAQLTPGVRAGFSWAKIEEELLDGFPDGALNIAHEAVDRHVANGFGSDTALGGFASPVIVWISAMPIWVLRRPALRPC